MQTKHLNAVGPGERVKIEGSMGKIIVDGDIGERAHVFVNGSMGMIQVGGYIHAGARVYVRGSMGKIYHSGAHPSASVEVEGSMGQVFGPVMRVPKDPPDRSGLEFGPPRPPRPPKPPRPPRPPRMPSWFQSSQEDIHISGVGQSVKIVGDEVWINGEKITGNDPPDQEKWVDTALGKKTLQVQKSNRPRELWGT